MGVMTMEMFLARGTGKAVAKTLEASQVWAAAKDMGLKDIAIYVSATDPTAGTLTTYWASAEQATAFNAKYGKELAAVGAESKTAEFKLKGKPKIMKSLFRG